MSVSEEPRMEARHVNDAVPVVLTSQEPIVEVVVPEVEMPEVPAPEEPLMGLAATSRIPIVEGRGGGVGCEAGRRDRHPRVGEEEIEWEKKRSNESSDPYDSDVGVAIISIIYAKEGWLSILHNLNPSLQLSNVKSSGLKDFESEKSYCTSYQDPRFHQHMQCQV